MTESPQPEPSKESPPAESVAGLAALRHRDFCLYLVARNLTNGCVSMINIAIGYQLYELTNDPLNLAFVGLTNFIPAIGLSLVTGYAADVLDRRKMLVFCFTVLMTGAWLFFFYTRAEMTVVWPIYAILLVQGTGRAFMTTVSQSYIPNLIPQEHLANAIAWFQTSSKLAIVLGPAVGGGLYLFGPDVVYATAGSLIFCSILMTGAIRTRTPREKRAPTTFRALFAGMVYVWEKKILMGSILLDLFVVLSGGVNALYPIFARDILEVGASGAGMMRSFMAVGGICAALVLTRFVMTKNVGVILFASVICYGLSICLFALSTWFPLTLFAMACVGASDMVSAYIRLGMVQLATPDHMRGRVNAVNSVFTGTSNEIGDFRAGMMAAAMGGVGAALVGGIGAVTIALIFWKAYPEVRNVQRMDRQL